MIVIERMQDTDLDEVLRIEQASFKYPWKRSFFERDMNQDFAHQLVARKVRGTGMPGAGADRHETQTQVLGYAIAWEMGDELHLANIAVAPETRCKGVGSRLLRQMMAVGRELGCCRMYLEVRRSNVAAQRFYQRHGFFQTGTRKGYYPDGEDALIMERELGREEDQE